MNETSKKLLVEQLRGIPSSPARVRDSRLRKLAIQFKGELENCGDLIPCNLEKWGFRASMSFDEFIYEAIYR